MKSFRDPIPWTNKSYCLKYKLSLIKITKYMWGKKISLDNTRLSGILDNNMVKNNSKYFKWKVDEFLKDKKDNKLPTNFRI